MTEKNIGYKKVQDVHGNTYVLEVEVIGKPVKISSEVYVKVVAEFKPFPKYRARKLRPLRAWKIVTQWKRVGPRWAAVHNWVRCAVPTDRKTFRSEYDWDFVYRIGRIATAPTFRLDPNIGCGPGLHYFDNKEAAKYWND